MRLFTGLDLPPAALHEMEDLIAELRPLAAIRWSAAANLHVTTKFIGEWPESRLDELKERLRTDQPPVSIAIRGLGFFSRIFWAGIERVPELMSLAARTEDVLEGLGIAKEGRPYAPHLTLARLPSGAPPANLRNYIVPLESRAFARFEAREFHLYVSRNSVYTKLATYPLGPGV